MPYSSLFWYSVNYVTMFLFAIQLSPWLTLKAGAISGLLKWSSQSRRVCKEQAKSAALSVFSVLHIPLMVAVSVFSKSHFSSKTLGSRKEECWVVIFLSLVQTMLGIFVVCKVFLSLSFIAFEIGFCSIT